MVGGFVGTVISTGPEPVATHERVEALDVLRGMALFGVFLMNFTAFAGEGVMATELQTLSLPTAGLDHAVEATLDFLMKDKANTIFAFLFGLGFYLQMSRLEARGRDAEAIYRRRLTVLLIIGIAHNCLLWNWDILHLYALAGFLLLAFRRAGNRTLVIAGLVLAAFGRTAVKALLDVTGSEAGDVGYSNSAALARQALSEQGDYLGLVRHFFDITIINYVLSGFLLGWLAYALGRFFIGAWVGRRGWITHAARFANGWRRLMRWGLLLGLLLEGTAYLMVAYDWPEIENQRLIVVSLHLLAVPVLAAGYVAAIVTGLQGGAARILGWFAPAGRMALTNYLTQSFVLAFVLFGVGPGLALAGKIGTTAVLGIVVVTYTAQVLFSRWWLGRFAYGPMEWVWRALTYGYRPPLRLA
jgi:uncharacterized protein